MSGYVSLLHGCCSLFKWEAIQDDILNKFFSVIESSEHPTCAEANELIVEDRLLGLLIYIQEQTKYELSFIPDAKFYNDPPLDMISFLKQRRRWNNGHVFISKKILTMAPKIIMEAFSRGITTGFFVIVFLLNQFLGLINIFFVFAIVLENVQVYFGTAIMRLILCSFLSLALISQLLPLKQGMKAFLVSSIPITIIWPISMAFFIYDSYTKGFMTQKDEKDQVSNMTLVKNLLPLLSFSYFVMPIILRPVDFLMNIGNYLVAFFSYIVFLPIL